MNRSLTVLLVLGLLPAATWSQSAEANAAPEPVLRRFEADDYRLAYDVFLGTGDLQAAFRLAQRAVRERPTDAAWRRRLAQVAEWLGRADIAAEQWQALFAQGDRSDGTVQQLLRLAPALPEPLAALPAWQHLARRRELDAQEWEQLYWLFEDAAEPARGSRYFEAEYRQRGLPQLLELAARLALHAGDDARALALYRERSAREPFSAEALAQAVAIEVRSDRFGPALALMRAQMHRIPEDDVALWRLLGQLAWENGDTATAEAAYARAIAGRDSQLQDWARLVLLTRERQPERAAELAYAAWQRHGQLDLLLQALEIYAERGLLNAQGRIYDSLDAAQRARAEQSLAFLLGRSQYHQRRGQPQAAWADLQRALRLAPRDDEVALSALWFLLDAGRSAELARLLQRYAGQALRNDRYAPVYAAGYQALGRAREAARWYHRALARQPDDAVLLSAYADVLQALGHTGMADRLRRQAWLQLQALRSGSADLAAALRHPAFDTWARLLADGAGGPAAAPALRRAVLQDLRVRAGPPAATDPRDALLLQAALDKQLPDSARRWMLQRYLALGRAAPLPAQARLALQQHDRLALAALLQQPGRRLDDTTRIELALALQRSDLAIDTAFEALTRQPAAEPFHELLRQQLPPNAHYLQWSATQADYGLLQRLGQELQARLVLSPALQLLLATTAWRQSSDDPDFATLLPGREDWQTVELRWLGRRDTRVALTQQQALQRYDGLRLQQRGRWAPRLDYELALRWHQPSELTLPLRVAGYEDSLRLQLGYALDRQTTLNLTPQLSRYHTQYADYLGSGSSVELGATHRLRNDYPDVYLRAYTEWRSYRRDGGLSAATVAQLPAYLQTGLGNGSIDPVGYFLPPDNSTVGLCAGIGGNLAGLSLPEDYSRAWRPYGWACATDNSVLGPGYNASAGLAGSVFGADQLRIEWQRSEANAPGGASIQILSIRYRHYF